MILCYEDINVKIWAAGRYGSALRLQNCPCHIPASAAAAAAAGRCGAFPELLV